MPSSLLGAFVLSGLAKQQKSLSTCGFNNTWLRTNCEGYSGRLLVDVHYCVEYYDERFSGSESGSIVEIWVPKG